MDNEAKFMNTTPSMVFELEKILDYLVENNSYCAKIGNTTISYLGIREDTSQGRRQIFEIERKKEAEDE